MKRRTLDLLFSAGGVLLAGLLLVLGMVMTSNANFARNYVKDQLSEQHITFKTAATLTDEEKKSDCLDKYAGPAPHHRQAGRVLCERLHRPPRQVRRRRPDLRRHGHHQGCRRRPDRHAQSRQPNDPALADLQAKSTTMGAQRETLFKGETLRGLLLTSFGFSVFGDKGGQVATVAYMAAALMVLLSIAGFAHAIRTPKNKAFAAPDDTAPKTDEPHLVS